MAWILVADDDDILREMLRFRIELAGHQVVSATDGQNALEYASSGKVDLVVLDAMMPILSGIEVLKDLRAKPATAALPVIMLTARKGERDVVTALENGADEYLTKPFIPQELLLRIARHLPKAAA